MRTLGVGGATIDTVLETDEVVVGGTLRGEVRVKGGASDQDIRGVTIEIVTRCLVETRSDNRVHAEIILASGTIELGRVTAGEELAAPLEIDIDPAAPISIGTTTSFVRTRVNVPGAVDPTDKDPVRLLPTPAMLAVISGLEQAGFALTETEVEHNPRRANPFVQEFDFRPRGFNDFGIDEVEISFQPIRGGVEVLLTVDNRGGFFTMGRERSARFQIRDADRSDIVAQLRAAISSLR
ncbi:sporulation protein [Palleronia marisminoris]|nr:sporulation protein [Palleronia marisminoris]